MAIIINLIVVLMIVAVFGAVIFVAHHALEAKRDPNRVNAKVMKQLAKDSSAAAKRGDYAERDRLDHMMNNMMLSQNPNAKPFKGTRHDAFHEKYLNE